jgi:hypothetical protein
LDGKLRFDRVGHWSEVKLEIEIVKDRAPDLLGTGWLRSAGHETCSVAGMRRAARAAVLVGACCQWLACGQASPENESSVASTGGGDTGGGDAGTDSAVPEPIGKEDPWECELCSVYEYCDGDTLVQQLEAYGECYPTTTSCEHGCLETSGWVACAIECGGQVCPVPPALSIQTLLCCMADGRCGVGGGDTSQPECVGAEPDAPDDPDCPSWGSRPGCCRADGTCGVSHPVNGAGCVQAKDLGVETLVGCDGLPLPDAGS